MHTIQTTMPDPRLRPFVRCFAQLEISAQASSLAQTGLAQLEHTLPFYLRGQPTMDYWSGSRAALPRIHFVGAHTRSPGCAYFTGSVSAFGIFLKAFASWQLFRIPPAQFADQEFPGPRKCSDRGLLNSGSSSPSVKPFVTGSSYRLRLCCPLPSVPVRRRGRWRPNWRFARGIRVNEAFTSASQVLLAYDRP